MKLLTLLLLPIALLCSCMSVHNNGGAVNPQLSSGPNWTMKPGRLPAYPAGGVQKGQLKVQDIYRFCYPDCQNDSFDINNPHYINFMVGPCHYQAEYFTRVACTHWCDIYISRVFSLDPPPCGSGTTILPSAILDAAERAAIFDCLSWGYLPCTPDSGCSAYWRIVKGGCWSWQGGGAPPSWYDVLANCDAESCCLCPYQICNNGGNFVVTKLQCVGTPPTCPPGCTPVCE